MRTNSGLMEYVHRATGKLNPGALRISSPIKPCGISHPTGPSSSPHCKTSASSPSTIVVLHQLAGTAILATETSSVPSSQALSSPKSPRSHSRTRNSPAPSLELWNSTPMLERSNTSIRRTAAFSSTQAPSSFLLRVTQAQPRILVTLPKWPRARFSSVT